MLAALPPSLNWHQLGAVHLDLGALLIVAAGVLYGVGVWRVGRSESEASWPVRRTVAFFGGLVVTFVAIECVIGVYDNVLFYDHMIQHLLLIMIASPLFAMGAPLELLERATTGKVNRAVVAALRSKVGETILNPFFAFVLYAFIIPFCHLTTFYNLTLTNEPIHDLEHLMFLVVGYLFWRPVVAIEPGPHPLHPGVRLLYLALAVPVDTFTGLTLASASHELFPAYLSMHRHWGPSLLLDLHMGGAIMWVGGDSLMFLAMIPIAILWVRYEDRRALEIDAQLALESQQVEGGAQQVNVQRRPAFSAWRPAAGRWQPAGYGPPEEPSGE